MTTTPTQQGRLQGKTAVITGATTGLGFEAARQFIAHGASKVIITGQSRERLDAAAATLGPAAIPVLGDVRRMEDLDALAARAKAELDRLDILFANAGIALIAPLEAVTEAQFDAVFDTNVKGLFFTVQRLSPLLGKGSSVILNSSAIQGKGAMATSAYAATKAAIRSFARSLAVELGSRGVRVNALSAGMVPTQLFERAGLDAATVASFDKIIEQAAPLGRVGRPEEIAAAAVFLASDESSYISAADLIIDGGYAGV